MIEVMIKITLTPAQKAAIDSEIFAEIKEVLEARGLPMEHCPPAWYPEAICKLYLFTIQATVDCCAFHEHLDIKAREACVHHAIPVLAKAQEKLERRKNYAKD